MHSTSPVSPVAILGWIRTAVVPRHGAFRLHQPHTLAAPLIRHLLQHAGLQPHEIDALLLGNALGAGGNPARLAALAADLPTETRALSIDTQCCAGLDTINLGASLIQSGQADLVIAGGAEAWSRAPIRQHRPLHPDEKAIPFERPACTPWPDRDPDPLQAAAHHASQHPWTRSAQDRYAQQSHLRAVQARSQLQSEILPIDGIDTDAYPRHLSDAHLARMPVVVPAHTDDTGIDCSLSRLAISPQADGAAFILLASEAACQRLQRQPAAWWIDGLQRGGDPTQPMRCALPAARQLLQRHQLQAHDLDTLELHDAFSVQGLECAAVLDIDPSRINPGGGGIARGHPIGASGAIALVRTLATLHAQTPHTKENRGNANAPRYGLACIAAVGGLGTATLVSLTRPADRFRVRRP
ncbi:MAG: thiolase family protein [Lautropia sp.]|nr:thiolase family protein [Lautropia sp.]